jgi:hypothetical protein
MKLDGSDDSEKRPDEEIKYMTDRAAELLSQMREVRDLNQALLSELRRLRKHLLAAGYDPDHPWLKMLDLSIDMAMKIGRSDGDETKK